MTKEEIEKVKNLSIKWIECNVGKKRDYKQKLIDAVNDLLDISDDYDSYNICDIDTWDWGKCWGMGERLDDLIRYDNIFNFTERAKNDFICTIRIAMDFLIEESGGVFGFTIGDVQKFVKLNPEFNQDIDKVLELDKLLLSTECNTVILL